MNINGFVMAMGKMLFIEPEGKGWSICIRQKRADQIEQNINFYDFHGKNLTKNDIAKFVPNFKGLKWKEIDCEPYWTELAATDNDYKINLIRHNKYLTKDNMLNDFLMLME